MSFMRFSLLFVPRDPRDAAPSPQHAAAVAKLPVLRLRCGRSIRPTSAMKRLGTRIDDRRSFVCWTVGTCPATENEMSIFKKTALSFAALRSEEHTSEIQSLMRISYAVFCWKKHKKQTITQNK